MKIVHFANAVEGLVKRLLGSSGPLVPKTTDPRLCGVAERLGIEIITDFDCHEPEWSFQKLTDREKEVFGKLLADEFAIYSPGIIRAAGVDRVFMCTHLSSPRESAAGFTDMSMFAMNSLILQLSQTSLYTSRTIHHELFHAIDYSDDLMRFVDTGWKKLAEKGFLYDREMNFPPDRGGNQACYMPGFITSYSRTAVHEDKAELYASMILDHGYIQMRAEQEPILAAKVRRMKKLLKDFHPDYNDNFWHLMNARSYAPKSYWTWIRNAGAKRKTRV